MPWTQAAASSLWPTRRSQRRSVLPSAVSVTVCLEHDRGRKHLIPGIGTSVPNGDQMVAISWRAPRQPLGVNVDHGVLLELTRRVSVVIAIAVVALLFMPEVALTEAAEPPRPCGGIEGFQILAATPRTTCSFAMATARKVRFLAFHNEGRGLPHHFTVRVRGRRLSCFNTIRHRLETIPCQGRHRKVVVEYTAP
jgi:hypothetical protein